jgi:glyoxylate reductase
MKPAIYITREIPSTALSILTAKGYDVTINSKKRALSQRELIRELKKKPYTAVLSLLTDAINTPLFDAVPHIKCYANFATGFDNIDLAEATKRGIVITNAPAQASAEAVAEHTIALMLALAARVVEADEFMRRGKYKGWEPMNFIGTDVLGKTLGIIGAGRIGSRVAHYATGLGMKVLYHDIAHNASIEQEGAQYIDSIDSIIQHVDIVTLHVPLMDSTKHLMNEQRLSSLKPGAMLINTSRGPVVDERALVRVLKEGTLSGAALDVFEFEPKLTPGLKRLQNVILTPHIASASIQARNEMADIAAQNIIDFIEGKEPRNKVNK